MKPDTKSWLAGLRESAAALRRTGTAPPVEPAAAAAEGAILAAHLSSWLDCIPGLLESRRAHALALGTRADPEAAIVITTSPIGITTAEELLGRDEPTNREMADRIAWVTEREYRGWCMRHPDDEHLLHVNHWTWVKTRVPSQRDAEFARHPLRAGERYWLHRVGTAGAGGLDRRATHLWRFDGTRAALLEPFVTEARVAPPRP